MNYLEDESGSVLILTVLSSTLLLCFLAVAIDVGRLYYTQCQLQTLADAAAIAGGLEVSSCAGVQDCTVLTTAATSAITEGGSATPTLFTQCASASGTGILLTMNNGPCALSGDPNSGNANYVEAVVSQNVPTFFAGIFGVNAVQISARAEAGKAASSGPCALVVGTSGQTVTLNSGASITNAAGSTCGLQVNSSGTPAVMENSGATVKVTSYNVVGTVTNNGGTYSPTPTTHAASVADPYASLTAPTQPATSSTNTATISGNTTLQPGFYPSGINFNGSGYTVTLNPGLYYFGGGLNIGGAVTINGSGVTLYSPAGQLNMNSASTVNLTAPTAALSGCSSCAGMLIWQPASNPSQMNLNSGSNSNWTGVVYVPGSQLTLNGGSNATSYGSIVAQSLMVNSALSLSGGTGGSGNGSTTVSLAE